MAMLASVPGKPALKKGASAGGEITGIIGMAGDKVKGSFAISFSKPLILQVAENMLGETFSDIDETVIDLVGELTNISTGGAKAKLADDGHNFNMATPVIVSGKDHRIEHSLKGPVITIPFETEYGFFFVEISFTPSN